MPDWSLHLGDCLPWLQSLPAGSVDAVVTDPPYGIFNRFGKRKTSSGAYTASAAGKGIRMLEFSWDSPEIGGIVREGLNRSLAICARSAAVFVFTGIDIVGELLPVARQAGFVVKPAAWMKKHPPPAGNGNWWPSGFELAFYGYRKSPWFGDADPKRSNVFVADSLRHGQPGKCGHPTQKPLSLMRRIVESICPPGGLVLDPFAGSGTTGVAAIQTGRRFLGCEIDPTYHALATRRLTEAASATPLFAEADRE